MMNHIKPDTPIYTTFGKDIPCVIEEAQIDHGYVYWLTGKLFHKGEWIKTGINHPASYGMSPELIAFVQRIEKEYRPLVELPFTRIQFQAMVSEMANATHDSLYAINKTAMLEIAASKGYTFKAES